MPSVADNVSWTPSTLSICPFFAIRLFTNEGSHYKCWRLTGLYVFCSLLFMAGFITRVLGAFDFEDLIKYIVSICLVYAAPYV